MSVHYITQKTLNTNKCTKRFFLSIVTHSYMFRPCWVIFREKPFVVVTLCCTIQFSENVLLTVHCAVYGGVNSFVVGPTKIDEKKLFVHLLVFKVFCSKYVLHKCIHGSPADCSRNPWDPEHASGITAPDVLVSWYVTCAWYTVVLTLLSDWKRVGLPGCSVDRVGFRCHPPSQCLQGFKAP
jgi:hypothetical protein